MAVDAGTALGSGAWQGDVFRPNEPIPIADTRIVDIDRKPVDIPTRVVQKLFPRPALHLECSGVPPFAWEQCSLHHRLGLADGITVEATVASLVPGSSYRWAPTSQPQMVVDDDTAISSADFLVVNFRWFRGDKDLHLKIDDAYQRVSAFRLPFGSLIVELTAVSGLHEILRQTANSAGFAVTHTGRLFRPDGDEFTAQEADMVIRGLTLFLSFLRGSRCGIASVAYTTPDAAKAWLRLGAGHVTRGGSARSWLSGIDSGDSIPGLSSSFWKHFGGEDGAALEYILNWYLTAAESSYHVGIIMAQAALERLSAWVHGPARSVRPGNFIRMAMKDLGLESRTNVPATLSNLRKFMETRKIDHGPWAIVEVRNDIVHPEQKGSPISARTQLEAADLAEYYVELMLLKKFSYSGEHWNRISDVHESVPWIQSDGLDT